MMRIFKSDRPRKVDGKQTGGRLGRFRRDRDGGVTIEFAILAIPFFLLVFAIIETCVAFAAEQTLNYAVDKLGRQLRTGQITFNTGTSTDLTEEEFKTSFCKELSIMIKCGTDVDDRLFLDLKSYANFGAMPTKVPYKSGEWGDLDTSGFAVNPGGSASVNMLRAFYKWKVSADLVRPYITNIRVNGTTPEYYLIVATTAYRNEAY